MDELIKTLAEHLVIECHNSERDQFDCRHHKKYMSRPVCFWSGIGCPFQRQIEQNTDFSCSKITVKNWIQDLNTNGLYEYLQKERKNG